MNDPNAIDACAEKLRLFKLTQIQISKLIDLGLSYEQTIDLGREMAEVVEVKEVYWARNPLTGALEKSKQ